MPSRKKAVASLAMSAVLVAAAGCGGGGGGNKPALLTKAEVIKRGTVICKEVERRAASLPEPTTEHPFAKTAPPAVQHKARQWVVGMAEALDYSRARLLKLAAPAQDRALLDGYLRDIGTVVTGLRAAAKADGSKAEAQAMHAFALFERASKQTAAYGFPKGVCGAGDSG